MDIRPTIKEIFRTFPMEPSWISGEVESPCRSQGSKAPERTAMPPVKLVLPGEYWDTQIYQGRLYLFARDGSIATLNWDKLVDNVVAPDTLRLALTCAFKRSDYFYRVADIFYDPEIREVITRRFDTLSDLDLVVAPADQERVLVSQQDNPFPFPHADSTIYRRQLFVGTTKGVFTADCAKRRKRAVSNDVDKLWDAPISSIKASWGSLALAGGDEGLWEYDLDFDFDSFTNSGVEDPVRIAMQHCSECHWAYYSIFGSSSKGPGFSGRRPASGRLGTTGGMGSLRMRSRRRGGGSSAWAGPPPDLTPSIPLSTPAFGRPIPIPRERGRRQGRREIRCSSATATAIRNSWRSSTSI
jgi:hypothetical protein